MNRKGDVFQILVVLIIIVSIAITGLIIGIMTHTVNTFFDAHPEIMPVNSTASNSNHQLGDMAPRITDYAIFFLFLGLNIGVMISATRTQFSATLIFMFILLVFIEILVAAGIVNIYQGLAHEGASIGFSSQLTLTNFILSKYTPLIMSCVALIVIVIMLGKSGGEIVT